MMHGYLGPFIKSPKLRDPEYRAILAKRIAKRMPCISALSADPRNYLERVRIFNRWFKVATKLGLGGMVFWEWRWRIFGR